jgi:uncharacterized membrane protein YfcA
MDTTLLLTAAILAFAAAVQMASGFGFALVATPLLAVTTGAHEAVLLTLLSAPAFNAWQAHEGRRDRDNGVVVRLLAGAVAGLPVGYVVYRVTEPRELTAIIGVLVVVAAATLAVRRPPLQASAVVDLAAGALVGALTTSTGTNGPPAVVLLQARRLSPEAFRGTLTTVFLVADVAAVAVFLVSGDLDLDVAMVAVWSAPALVAGALVGRWCRTLLSPAAFRVAVLVLLAGTGAGAVVTALV